jgi:hypothetical protein
LSCHDHGTTPYQDNGFTTELLSRNEPASSNKERQAPVEPASSNKEKAGSRGTCVFEKKKRQAPVEPAFSKKSQAPGGAWPCTTFLRNYLADEDEAAPLPPVELDAPEPEGEGDEEDDDDDPEPDEGADDDEVEPEAGVDGVVDDDEDEPPGATTVVFSFVLLLLLVEPVLPLLPGLTTVSLFSLHAPSASALSRTNIHEPCFLVISSPWGELQQVTGQGCNRNSMTLSTALRQPSGIAAVRK